MDYWVCRAYATTDSINMNGLIELLRSVFKAADARQKQVTKRSLCPINEYFEPAFNTATATQIVFQQSVNPARAPLLCEAKEADTCFAPALRLQPGFRPFH